MAVTEAGAIDGRKAKEALIRVIDMVVYVAAFGGGVFALQYPPDTIRDQLSGYEWLATFWGVLLLVAGSLGFLGRLSRLWIVEVPGTAAAIFGGAIYLVVLSAAALDSETARVAVTMVLIATGALVKRYVELQIFTTDPGVKTLSDRIEAALKRRTANTIASK